MEISGKFTSQKWYFVTKNVLTYCEKKKSSDQEKLVKFPHHSSKISKFAIKYEINLAPM